MAREFVPRQGYILWPLTTHVTPSSQASYGWGVCAKTGLQQYDAEKARSILFAAASDSTLSPNYLVKSNKM
jgi:hypothetical protein